MVVIFSQYTVGSINQSLLFCSYCMGVLFIHKMLVVISHEKVVLMYGGVI